MSQSVLSVRVENDVKKNFDMFCSDAGLNPSVAVNMFIKATLRERRIPFEIVGSYNPFHSNKNEEILLEAVRDVKEGKNMVKKTMAELEAMEND